MICNTIFVCISYINRKKSTDRKISNIKFLLKATNNYVINPVHKNSFPPHTVPSKPALQKRSKAC